MSRNRRASERAALTGEPYSAALTWIQAHPGADLIPEVTGAQADLEHDLYKALSSPPAWPLVVRWTVPDTDTITLHLDADHVDNALAAILPRHTTDTRRYAGGPLAGIAGVRATADGEHLLLTRGSATARLTSTAHLPPRLDGLRGPGTLWEPGTAISIAERRALGDGADDGNDGSGVLRRIGVEHQWAEDLLMQRSDPEQQHAADDTAADAPSQTLAAIQGRITTDEAHRGAGQRALVINDKGDLPGGRARVEYISDAVRLATGQGAPADTRTVRPAAMAATLAALSKPAGRGASQLDDLVERILGGLGGVVVLPSLFVRAPLPQKPAAENHVDLGDLRVSMRAGGWPDEMLPSGTVGRLLLMMLATSTALAGGRVVHLDAARTAGSEGPRIREHLMALAAMHVQVDRLPADDSKQGARFMVASDVPDQQRPTTVIVSEEFQAEATQWMVPLLTDAVRVLARDPAAVDLYAFLTYRLPLVQRPVTVPFTAVPGAGQPRRFPVLLDRVLAVYPQAKVALNANGLVLYSSPPSVPLPRSQA